MNLASLRLLRPGPGSGFCLVLMALGFGPAPVSGQTLPVTRSKPVPPVVLGTREISMEANPDSPAVLRSTALAETQEAVLTHELERKIELFSTAGARARAAVGMDPENPENLFALAMTLGLWVDYVGIRDKIRMGEEIYQITQRILEIDPNHAGGHHVLGRLHSGAMSLPRVARFLAHRLLGSSMLGMASWEGAEEHLRQAEVLDPNVMIHHLELAILYLKLNRSEEAAVELQHTLDLEDRFLIDGLYRERASEYLGMLSSGHSPPDPTSFISGL